MGEQRFITIPEYRPCIATGQKALFHCWYHEAYVERPSSLRGGSPGGQISNLWAVVEMENGEVIRVLPWEIKFLDHRFKDYNWSEDK